MATGLFVIWCVEIGLFLFLIPWSSIWERNVVSQFPLLRPFLLSHYIRGAIGGLGLVNLWLGLSQVWSYRQ